MMESPKLPPVLSKNPLELPRVMERRSHHFISPLIQPMAMKQEPPPLMGSGSWFPTTTSVSTTLPNQYIKDEPLVKPEPSSTSSSFTLAAASGSSATTRSPGSSTSSSLSLSSSSSGGLGAGSGTGSSSSMMYQPSGSSFGIGMTSGSGSGNSGRNIMSLLSFPSFDEIPMASSPAFQPRPAPKLLASYDHKKLGRIMHHKKFHVPNKHSVILPSGARKRDRHESEESYEKKLKTSTAHAAMLPQFTPPVSSVPSNTSHIPSISPAISPAATPSHGIPSGSLASGGMTSTTSPSSMSMPMNVPSATIVSSTPPLSSTSSNYANQTPPSPPTAASTTAGSGSSCHQCKSRRPLSNLIFCQSQSSKKNKNKKQAKLAKDRNICRKKYCDVCLGKFYNEKTPVRKYDIARRLCLHHVSCLTVVCGYI
jgi:hypothetical protein